MNNKIVLKKYVNGEETIQVFYVSNKKLQEIDDFFKRPIHKLNGGNGATLCVECSVVICTGLKDILYCDNCKKKVMTPKQKAEELVAKFIKHSRAEKDIKPIQSAKQCALIAVDNIIASNPHSNPFNTEIYSTMSYWLEVKQEIQKL